MLPVLFREITLMGVILAYWIVGYALHPWSQQGRAPALRYFTAPGWVALLCGRSTADKQLALSGLLIQGMAWLWAVVWLLLILLRVSPDARAVVFFAFFAVLLLILLTLAVVQAVTKIVNKS
ncbi:MAG TPA: hypothetical protein PKH77_28760 [Anaerolineae bacterium]|nr:hypothetical protein [Anaerolineae bacterium]